jgi:hypothetical protein
MKASVGLLHPDEIVSAGFRCGEQATSIHIAGRRELKLTFPEI